MTPHVERTMRSIRIVTLATAVLMALWPHTSSAQAVPAGRPAAADDPMEVRYQLAVMERTLELAVQRGAQIMGRRMPDVAPQMLLFSGPVKARGFRLDGYGVFFHVEVPVLRRSVLWSFQTLEQHDLGLTKALQSIRQYVGSVRDSNARTSLEQALRRIELQMGPILPQAFVADAGLDQPVVGGTPAQPVTPSRAVAEPARPTPAPRPNADELYTTEVRNALIDAMLDHSGSLPLDSGEWMTVAARDNEDRIAIEDAHDSVTIVLRVQAADLESYRAGRLSREEARKRVEVREF